MNRGEFNDSHLDYIRAFLAQVRDRAKPDREEVQKCRQPRGWGDRAWAEYGLSETDIQIARWWYQYRHKPGSKNWEPLVILRALVAASERDYVEPERIPPNERALKATPADKKQARVVFIRKHGVAAFFQHVNPILVRQRCAGVGALFAHPATPETRAYVAILAQIVSLRGELESVSIEQGIEY